MSNARTIPVSVDMFPLALIESSLLAHRLSFSRNQGTAVTLPPLMYGEAITTLARDSMMASANFPM